jgi:NAD(P)H-nitrite reductase large subunit
MNILIIGNGITGITAALRLREKQPSWNIAIISGESKFHYSRPALMYIFMGHQTYQETKPYPDSHWEEQRIELVRDWVTGVDTETSTVQLKNGGARKYDQLLIACGSKPNMFGWPGQDLEGVQGLYDLMDLSNLYKNVKVTREAVIVGGGLIGLELAEMLHSAGVHITFLVRETSYWNGVMPKEESLMIGRAIAKEGMRVLYETSLDHIVDDGTGRCCAVVTDKGQRIETQFVGLTAGVSPRIDIFKDTPIETGRGILVNDSLRTSVDNVFSAGDCAEIRRPEGERNLLEQVWYTGKYQGTVVANVMSGEKVEYHPGIWHNAAKFLEIEYHTYGRINRGDEELYWEAPDGEHSIRIAHADGKVVGFNLMGIRFRHKVCERWLRDECTLEYVIEHLGEADFDPEFYPTYTSALQALGKGSYAR